MCLSLSVLHEYLRGWDATVCIFIARIYIFPLCQSHLFSFHLKVDRELFGDPTALLLRHTSGHWSSETGHAAAVALEFHADWIRLHPRACSQSLAVVLGCAMFRRDSMLRDRWLDVVDSSWRAIVQHSMSERAIAAMAEVVRS